MKKLSIFAITVILMGALSACNTQTPVESQDTQRIDVDGADISKETNLQVDIDEKIESFANGIYNRCVWSVGDDVYYTDFQGIYKIGKNDEEECLYTGRVREGIAVYKTWIYFLPDNTSEEKNAVYRISMDGGNAEKVIEGTGLIEIEGNYLHTLEAVFDLEGMYSDVVYALDESTGLVKEKDENMTALLKEKTPELEMGLGYVSECFVSEDRTLIEQNVYAGNPFVEYNRSGGVLEYHLKKSGQVELVFSKDGTENVIAVADASDKIANDFVFEWPVMYAGDYVFYTDMPATSDETEIYMKEINGGEAELLISDLTDVELVNFDGNHLYYLTKNENWQMHLYGIGIESKEIMDIGPVSDSIWNKESQNAFIDLAGNQVYYYNEGVQKYQIND